MYIYIYSIVYMFIYIYCVYIHTTSYLFTCWWNLGCFLILAIVNNADMNIGILVSFQISVLIFLRYTHRSAIAGPYGISMFIFWKISTLFSTMAATTHISTNSAQRFPFFHFLAKFDICGLLMTAILMVWGVISLQFWFAFLWWEMMLSIF